MDGDERGCEAGKRSGGGGGITEKKEGPMRFFGERDLLFHFLLFWWNKSKK